MFLDEVEGSEHHQQKEHGRGSTGEADGGGCVPTEFVKNIAHLVPLHVRVPLVAQKADGRGGSDCRK